jgi:Domain of unknown function (DUF4912)
MKGENSKSGSRKPTRSGFRISVGAMPPSQGTTAGTADVGLLPSSYGAPILFAIPRDPRTVFVYWNIDWSDAFARNAPADRQVYLRLKRPDGSDEIEEPVEPMLGSHFLLVTEPKAGYQVELGFYQPPDVWNSIAISDPVTMPPDTSSENADVDIATVPFHLSFQRMVDLFRAQNGNAIASVLSRLQERAEELDSDSSAALSNEEREILRAMDLSLADLAEARRDFADFPVDDFLRKRAEAVLGFGAGTSPAGGPGGSSPGEGFGGSSWSSGLS